MTAAPIWQSPTPWPQPCPRSTKESPSTYQLKELLKKEIKRLETNYLSEIKAQYAALLPTIITDEQTTSLDTLEKLKIQLTNILI